jgi:hypothetical protein
MPKVNVSDLQPKNGYQPRKAIAAGLSHKGDRFGCRPYTEVHGSGGRGASKYYPDGVRRDPLA